MRSNSKSKLGQAYASQDNTLSLGNFSNFGKSKLSSADILSQYKTPKERFEKPHVTHHNMPIQSKINKGVGSKLQSEASPRSVFGSDFWTKNRSRIKPQANFTVSNSAFTQQ